MPDNDLTKAIITAIVSRGAMGESQIQETIQRNTHTQAIVPLAQAGLLLLALPGMALGGWLIVQPLSAILELLTVPDLLLLASLSAVALYGTNQLLRRLLARFEAMVMVLCLIAAGLVIVGTLLAVVPDVRAATEVTDWAAFGLGVGLFVGSLALAMRIIIDLLDPFGRSSPAERQLMPALISMLQVAEQQPADDAGGWIRVRSANDLQALLSRQQPEPDHLPRAGADFVDFLVEARRRGIQRRDWLGPSRQRYRLPSTGTRVTRQVYENLIDEAAAWGFIRKAQRSGLSHEWIVPVDQALRLLGTAMYGGHS